MTGKSIDEDQRSTESGNAFMFFISISVFKTIKTKG